MLIKMITCDINDKIGNKLKCNFMSVLNKNRWALSTAEANFGRFQVLDCLLNKRVAYYVPNLSAVSVNGNSAIVHTTTGKNLLIQLDANSRRFIS